MESPSTSLARYDDEEKPLPADAKRCTELVHEEQERWYRRRARMRLTRKIMTLDRLLEQADNLPRLETDRRRLS